MSWCCGSQKSPCCITGTSHNSKAWKTAGYCFVMRGCCLRFNFSLTAESGKHSELIRSRPGLQLVTQNRSQLRVLASGVSAAASNGTGFVKCFTYWQALHFHRNERSPCDCPTWFNAFAAMSRVASSAAFSLLTAGSINSVPFA